jgi:hypothetical protein
MAQSDAAMAAGMAAVEAGRFAAARAAARMAPLPAGLDAALCSAADLGTRLVVRSSSPLDDDARWAGAFGSYGEVSPAEVHTALRGCWASAFTPDVMARKDLTGVPSHGIRLAALIQPQVEPRMGGWAEIRNGIVRVAAVEGAPAPLLAGWALGTTVTVDSAGEVRGATASGAQIRTFRRVAGLARAVRHEFGTQRLEWALVDSGVVLLQLNHMRDDGHEHRSDPKLHPAGLPAWRRLAALMLRRRGPLAERMLAPWAGACESADPLPCDGPATDLLALARRLSQDLTRQVAELVAVESNELVDRIALGDPELGARLSSISVDVRKPRLVLGALEAVGEALVRTGQLRETGELWWQAESWVADAVGGAAAESLSRPVFDRFTSLLVGVASADGRPCRAIVASPGLAAGRGIHVARPDRDGRLAPGDILVVDAALPAFAPLLWRASGLVARLGDPAAHLFEVARVLRLPAVVAHPEWRPLHEPAMIGLDATAGEFWVSDLDHDLEPATSTS